MPKFDEPILQAAYAFYLDDPDSPTMPNGEKLEPSYSTSFSQLLHDNGLSKMWIATFTNITGALGLYLISDIDGNVTIASIGDAVQADLDWHELKVEVTT